MYQFRNSSFTKEQLTNLGITKDINSSQQFNRPLFPLMIAKPIELEKNNVAIDYKVLFKEDFRSRLFEIHNTSSTINKDIDMDTYSLQIAAALEKEHKKKLQFTLATKLMPAELSMPATSKRKSTKPPAIRPAKRRRVVVDVEKRLDDLVKKEANSKEEDEESDKAENDSDVEPENEEVEDPELDDENDYGNNYFDNGENFAADEDDALDDGPVY